MIVKHSVATLGVLIVAGIALATFPARAGDPAKEAATASQHAGLAAKAPDMKTTQMHLHHVINCLVGPGNDYFDPGEANPCKDQGAGAIPDTTDKYKKQQLEKALTKARKGLKVIARDWPRSQRYAVEAQAELAPVVGTASK